MPLDWREAQHLDAAALQNALLAEVDVVMAPHLGSPADEDKALKALAEPLRAMWLINWLDFEVMQGSLLAYFYNSHGRHAHLAEDVLRRIGAIRMADVIAQGRTVVEAGSEAWETRRAQMDQLPEYSVVHPYQELSGADALSALTEVYWRAADEDDWGNRLGDYLKAEVRVLASG